MEKEYRVFCKCIEDVVKFEECETCPHYKNDVLKYCSYNESEE